MYDRSPEQITIGCGTCELLYLLADAVLERGDEVVLAQPSFTSYRDVIDIRGAVPVAVPLQEYTHDLEAMAAAVTPRTRMIFVCNPNNPTGTYVPSAEVARLVERVPDDVLVVIDEAYIEFVTAADREGSLAIQKAHDNVVVLRTFSKIYGLCGLRRGTASARRRSSRPSTRCGSPSTSTCWGSWRPSRRSSTRTRWRSAAHQRAAARPHGGAARGARARHGPHQANFMLVEMNDLCDPHDRCAGRCCLWARSCATATRWGARAGRA